MSVCLYVCLCVQIGMISKFPRCPVVSILRVLYLGQGILLAIFHHLLLIYDSHKGTKFHHFHLARNLSFLRTKLLRSPSVLHFKNEAFACPFKKAPRTVIKAKTGAKEGATEEFFNWVDLWLNSSSQRKDYAPENCCNFSFVTSNYHPK